MFVVESYAAVRRFVFVEGHSRREAARVFGLSRVMPFFWPTRASSCHYSSMGVPRGSEALIAANWAGKPF
jgi:hypothetical protein